VEEYTKICTKHTTKEQCEADGCKYKSKKCKLPNDMSKRPCGPKEKKPCTTTYDEYEALCTLLEGKSNRVECELQDCKLNSKKICKPKAEDERNCSPTNATPAPIVAGGGDKCANKYDGISKCCDACDDSEWKCKLGDRVGTYEPKTTGGFTACGGGVGLCSCFGISGKATVSEKVNVGDSVEEEDCTTHDFHVASCGNVQSPSKGTCEPIGCKFKSGQCKPYSLDSKKGKTDKISCADLNEKTCSCWTGCVSETITSRTNPDTKIFVCSGEHQFVTSG